MTPSKAWNWKQETSLIWQQPSEESYAVAAQWKQKNIRRVLDFGCGLGRHAIFFAQQGFTVSAFDLSQDGTAFLRRWAERENLPIDVKNADMLHLPYGDSMFDAIFAYYVISHTDSEGIRQIIHEIERILKVGGELYVTLCSKETWSFRDAGYPKLDANTVIKTDAGPEQGIPHFYVALDDILALFSDFEIEKIRHTDDCYYAGRKQNSKHYFVSARLRKK